MQCPLCGGEVEPAGVVLRGEELLTAFLCERCIRPWEFDGVTFQAAFVFAVDQDGNTFDPESLERLPPRSDAAAGTN